MMRKSVLGVAVAAMALCCLSGHLEECIAAAPQKIGLRVLYVGHPGSARESDFVGFLEKHFAKVGKGSVEEFQEEQADSFDVVIVRMPGLRVSSKYTRPTMTLAGAGASIYGPLGLKADPG